MYVVEIISKEKEKHYDGKDDIEGLRYRVKYGDAEIFREEKEAENCIVNLRQIKALTDYEFVIKSILKK